MSPVPPTRKPRPAAAQMSPTSPSPVNTEGVDAPGFRPPELLDRMREAIRVRHHSIRTEDTYVDWVHRFILFRGKRHPQELGADEVVVPLRL